MIRAALILVLALAALITGGLLANRPPWLQPPGPWARLLTYVTTNVAELREESIFPELRPRRYALAGQDLYEVVRDAMHALAWNIVRDDPERRQLDAVVRTPVLRFTDDVAIRIDETAAGISTLYGSSRSRVGRGDLAANTRHMLDLIAAIDRELTNELAR